MINISKIPNTFRKWKDFYAKTNEALAKIFKDPYDCCACELRYCDKSDSMKYKISRRLFTEVEIDWLANCINIRNKKFMESCITGLEKTAMGEFSLRFYLLGGCHYWEKMERKRILNEERQSLADLGINCGDFRKRVIWFIIISDKYSQIAYDKFSAETEETNKTWDFDESEINAFFR